MKTKLTLSLPKEVIDQAKAYAKKNNVSLSSLVENYLLKLVSEFKPKNEVLQKGSIVNELSGIVNLSSDLNHQEELSDYLSNSQ